MKDHFNFDYKQMTILKEKGVGIPELFKFANEFDPTKQQCEIGFINLLFYIDKKGDPFSKPIFKSKLICEQIFENLDIKDKIAVHEYLDLIADGVF